MVIKHNHCILFSQVERQIKRGRTTKENKQCVEIIWKNFDFQCSLTSLVRIDKVKRNIIHVFNDFKALTGTEKIEEDICYRFGVHRTIVSRNFHKVLNIMYVKLYHPIKWPERETLRETLQSDLRVHAKVWSHYKHHSTIKFLIGITPQGTLLGAF